MGSQNSPDACITRPTVQGSQNATGAMAQLGVCPIKPGEGRRGWDRFGRDAEASVGSICVRSTDDIQGEASRRPQYSSI